MNWWQKLSKALGYIINPAGILIDQYNANHEPSTAPGQPDYQPPHNSDGSVVSNSSPVWWNKFTNWVSGVWNDITGKSQIELQNELNRELAEEEYQRNLQSIGDTAAAYEAAGFNRNILYGGSNGSPISYSAPQLQSYTGSKKLDTILQRTGQVLNMIPAMYQATAALEGIDQARERTKQSEIKTMSMGMSLLDQGYKLGKTQASFDWWPNIAKDWFSSKRHFKDFEGLPSRPLPITQFGNSYQKYSDAALKNQFDLLESIGIKNQMNSTLNNWRGYQYSLDRRFGAAGRIVGMSSQGLRSVGSFFSPIKLKTHL